MSTSPTEPRRRETRTRAIISLKNSRFFQQKRLPGSCGSAHRSRTLNSIIIPFIITGYGDCRRSWVGGHSASTEGKFPKIFSHIHVPAPSVPSVRPSVRRRLRFGLNPARRAAETPEPQRGRTHSSTGGKHRSMSQLTHDPNTRHSPRCSAPDDGVGTVLLPPRRCVTDFHVRIGWETKRGASRPADALRAVRYRHEDEDGEEEDGSGSRKCSLWVWMVDKI